MSLAIQSRCLLCATVLQDATPKCTVSISRANHETRGIYYVHPHCLSAQEKKLADPCTGSRILHPVYRGRERTHLVFGPVNEDE